MTAFSEPTKWAQSLGATANADVIPDEAGAMDVDISKIFPAVFSVPLSQGGKAIPRRTLNGLLKLLGDWLYYYQQGGVASYSDTVDYVPGRVVLYNVNLYKCIRANGASSTVVAPDSTTPSGGDYWTKIPTQSDLDEISVKTGDIKIHTTSTIPNGWLLCNGAAISRTTYANLFDKIGTTYGSGDGSTTFNIPDLRDRYIMGANANALGTQIAEQLPNIYGQFTLGLDAVNGVGVNIANGCFAAVDVTGVYNLVRDSTGRRVNQTVELSASRSSAIYTDSGKVYPLSLALNFIIKT